MKRFLLVLLSVWASQLLYTELSHFWTEAGGFSGGLRHQSFELLFSALVTLLFFVPRQKNFLLSWLAPAAPLLGFYALHDLFFNFLSRGPRLSDLQTANLLFDFSPLLGVIFPLYLLLLFTPFFLQLYRYKQAASGKAFIRLLLSKVLIAAVVFVTLQSAPFQRFFLDRYYHYKYLESRTVRKNGRLSTMYFHFARSEQAKKRLAAFRRDGLDITGTLFPGQIEKKRNVYIVVLESFLDPRLLEDVSFSPDPLADELEQVMRHRPFSLARSPVYGGSTSQAEFEILTGAPALARLGSIEFNSMEGYPMESFVHRLRQEGYRAFATVATSSLYFNSRLAYRSLGFESVDFLEETPAFEPNPHDGHIFDGDLFRYNLEKLETEKGPFVFYTLGMYGHYPFARNKIDRPDTVAATPADTLLTNAANTFFYRTKALGDYLSEIIRRDPDALIYVSSDHLPPLLSDTVRYRYGDRHLNIALLIDRGEVVDVNGTDYFRIPQILNRRLTGEPSPALSPQEREHVYMKMMSESIIPPPQAAAGRF